MALGLGDVGGLSLYIGGHRDSHSLQYWFSKSTSIKSMLSAKMTPSKSTYIVQITTAKDLFNASIKAAITSDPIEINSFAAEFLYGNV